MAGNQDQTQVDIPALQAALAQAQEEGEQMAQEIASLKRSLAAQKGQTTRARNEASALEAQLPPKPRALAPIENKLTAHELLELIEDADEIEVAFSDSETELKGLAPRSISGDAWQVRGDKLQLRVPELRVRNPGERTLQLDGYALIVDGEQVAYAGRGDVLALPSGKVFDLKDDVAF